MYRFTHGTSSSKTCCNCTLSPRAAGRPELIASETRMLCNVASLWVSNTTSLTTFPLIVKPTAMDASIGIDAKSVVHNVEELMERVQYIHNEFHNPALVEQYIDGREIYVSMIGNPPQVLPPIEWDLSKLPPDLPRIAGTEAKWEHDFKEAKEFVPEDITSNEEIMNRIREVALSAWNALLIRDYARIDMRLAADGTPYVIEINPNPWLDGRAEFAMAARRGKPELSFGDLVEKIVELAMSREIHDRSNDRSVRT